MIKLVRSLDFNFDDSLSNIVRQHSRGAELTKQASTDSEMKAKIAELKPRKDHLYVHVLAVGDTEKTGPNKNNDGFRGAENKKCHHHFKTGCVFKDHKNSDPALSVGHVPISHYNEDMGRIELVIGLDKNNSKTASFVEDIENGKDLSVSMGSKVAYDVCSICDHKAHSPSVYCDHMKKHAGQVLEDGRQVYVDNPNPKYFDISVLTGRRPADRTAWSFQKVASQGGFVSSVDLAKEAGIVDPEEKGYNIVTLNTLRKLAEMEKEIEGVIDAGKSRELEALMPESNDKTKRVIKIVIKGGDDPRDVMDSLSSSQSMLGLPDFLQMILGNGFKDIEDDIPEIESFMPGCFCRMLNKGDDGSIADSMNGGNADYVSKGSKDALSGIESMIGLSEPVVRRRVTVSIISPKGVSNIKKASVVNASSSSLEALAELYANYKLASVINSGSNSSMMAKAAVATNYLKRNI